MVDEVYPESGRQHIERLLPSLADRWKTGSANHEALVQFLALLTARGITQSDVVFLAARECLLSRVETLEEFQAAAEFCERYPDSVSSTERELVRTQFEEFAGEYASIWGSHEDPDFLRQVAADLELLGKRLGVDTQGATQGLEERAEEIETERAEPDDDIFRSTGTIGSAAIEDVDAMFDGLNANLKDT